ncbi:MAG: class I SAM-dependent methyltransferase, partial [Chitinophagaceae bacterium]
EVGAGPGNFTSYLLTDRARSWTFVEPDPAFASKLAKSYGDYSLPVEVFQGTILNVGNSRSFDSIIYLDVLEHIEHDDKEIQHMIDHLNPGGFIIILCPAFNFLYSPFDKAIGHYRRYTRTSLLKLFPASLNIRRAVYLDSTGFLASAANKLMLKQSYPSQGQVKFWDRLLVPCSRFTDIVFSRFFGRSILVVAQKANGA